MSNLWSLIRRFLLLFYCVFMARESSAQILSISSPSDTLFCSGDTIRVAFSAFGTFNAGNIFSLRLSDATGSFTNAVTIDTLPGTTSGFLEGGIPLTTVTGAGYRVRIESSSPPMQSGTNNRPLTIIQTPLPNAVAPSACVGDTLRLFDGDTSVTDVSFIWSGPSFTSFDKNPFIPNAQLSASGTYLLTADRQGCKRSSAVVATVNPIPVSAPIIGSPVLCEGDSIKLTMPTNPAGTIYQWSGPGFGNNGRSVVIPNATIANSGIYTGRATLGTCSSSDLVAITVNPTPAKPVAVSEFAACNMRPLSVDATSTTPGVSYSWIDPTGFIHPTQGVYISTASTTYSGDWIASVQLGNCISRDTLTITVQPTPGQPTTSYTGGCVGDSLILSATSDMPGVNKWYHLASGYSDSAFSAPVKRANIQLTDSGMYKVYVVSAAGCASDTDSIRVIIADKPVLPNLSSNSPVCAGGTLRLGATGNAVTTTYSWTGPGSYSVAGPDLTRTPATTDMTGTYVVTVTSGACSTLAQTQVEVKPANTPVVTIAAGPDAAVTPGTLITFKAVTQNSGSNPAYQWQKNGVPFPGAADSIFTVRAGIDVADKDKVSVLVRSNAECPLPDSITSYVFTVSVKNDGGMIGGDSVSIYPNPAKMQFTLQGVVSTTQSVAVAIINMAGAQVYEAMLQPYGNSLNHPITTDKLSPGVYLLRLKIGERYLNKRLIITE